MLLLAPSVKVDPCPLATTCQRRRARLPHAALVHEDAPPTLGQLARVDRARSFRFLSHGRRARAERALHASRSPPGRTREALTARGVGPSLGKGKREPVAHAPLP
jgi:hypothetical protein